MQGIMKRLARLLITAACCSAPLTSVAQGNPTPADCGLPAEGTIRSSVTYTLTADCAQTGALTISTPSVGSPDTVLTVDGSGFTVSLASANVSFISGAGPRTSVSLSDLTIDGQGVSRSALFVQATALTAERVTFTGSNGGTALGTSDANLTDVLFEDNFFSGIGTGSNGAALNFNTGEVTLTNAVVRNNKYGGGALLSHNGSIITNGCLSFSGNIPADVSGEWTDNSAGPCSGTVGNGGAILPPPSLLACGLPAPGNLDVNAEYSMSADCHMGLTGTSSTLWNVGPGVHITIRGNGHRLIGAVGDGFATLDTAFNSGLTLKNVHVEKVVSRPFGAVSVSHSTFTNTADRIFYLLGEAQFSNVLFEDITAPTWRLSNNGSVLIALSLTGSGQATFTNSAFRSITGLGGAPVLNTFGSGAITLNGCITFEGNTPGNYAGTVTDNSSGACGSGVLIGPDPGSFTNAETKNHNRHNSARLAGHNDGPSTGQSLVSKGYALSARYGLRSGVEFQRVDASGVGIQSIIDLGLIDAIDVWSYVEQGVEVCFPQQGHVLFLDAATAPRTVLLIDAYTINGYTCVFLNRPGTVVMTENAPPGMAMQSLDPGTVLVDCMVTTTDILNFRNGPGGDLLNGLIPARVTLTALRRTAGWFKVDYHGALGWISASYVITRGHCE